MFVRSLSALALSALVLAGCQDASPAGPASQEPGYVRVDPADYARLGITTPAAARARTAAPGESSIESIASIDYYSGKAYNGIVNGLKQIQLYSVQNGFSGISYHRLTSSFSYQPNCSGTYYLDHTEVYESFNGSPVGLSTMNTFRWWGTMSWLITTGHVFQAAPGYTLDGYNTNATYYSSDSYCG